MKNNKRLFLIIIGVIIILSIPLIAMQFTNEVNWSLFDFIIAGSLLLVTGLSIELILRKVTTAKHRFIIASILLLLLIIVWAELAVGIFNSPIAGN